MALEFLKGVGKDHDILIPKEYPFYSDVGQKVSCNKGCLNKRERNRTTLNNYLFFLCSSFVLHDEMLHLFHKVK